MDATQTANLKAFVNYLSDPVVAGILGAIGGVVLTLITKFGEGLINEIYENRKQRQLRKKQAAKDINSFCVEGMHKGFKIRAGSEHHIKFRATEIEAINEDVGLKLRQFIDAWSQYRDLLKNKPLSLDDERFAKEYKDRAQQLGEELLKTARKWGK